MPYELDIVIPVYNEGGNIAAVLAALQRHVRTPFRVLIAYDRDDDDTLPVLTGFRDVLPIETVRNEGRGIPGAVVTAFRRATAPAVLVYPADDDYNPPIIDAMVERLRSGCDIVAASRLMPGGRMVGSPWPKALLVRASALALHHVARVPTRDPTNGFRLFSARVIGEIPIRSTTGFAFSLELLVKVHRLRWAVCELPASWHPRRHGVSRFQLLRWLPGYLVWFGYAFATRFLSQGPATVRRRSAPAADPT